MKHATATTYFCIPLLFASASLAVAAPVSWWAFEKESKEIAHDQGDPFRLTSPHDSQTFFNANQ